MSYISKGFLGDTNIGVFKLGDSDVKLYLGDMLVYPLSCEDKTFYRMVGEPTYPSTIRGNDASFNLSFDWEEVHVDTSCTNSVIDSGNEVTTYNVGVNPSTADSRSFSGSYSFNGLNIPYNVTQEESVYNIVTVYNNTGQTATLKILENPNDFVAVSIDNNIISPITTAYTFTSGIHTVKYLTSNIIPYEALINCRQMTSVTLSDGVETINDYAFSNCLQMETITIPNTVKNINSYAFYLDSGLISVVIPDSVEYIGTSSFERSGLRSCTIGNGVKTIDENGFSFCQNLTALTIGNNVETIGESAFEQSYSLTSVNIPDSVKSIGRMAFRWGDVLSTVIIGSGITSIGNQAFYECSALTSITCNAITPPTLGSDAFYSTNNCPIYVPSDSVNAYKSASDWSTYASRIQAIK